jgi:hypothetical protein
MEIVISKIITNSDEEANLVAFRFDIAALRLQLNLIPIFPLLEVEQTELQSLIVELIYHRLIIHSLPFLQGSF